MNKPATDYLPLGPGLIVADVLARWPQAAQVFFRHRMACVGCPMAPFQTLAEAAAIYSLPVGCFLAELQEIIQLKEEAP